MRKSRFASSGTTTSKPMRRPPSWSRRMQGLPAMLFYLLRKQELQVLSALFLITFGAFFYAADLKGIWNDDAVRLTIANGGIAQENLEIRRPAESRKVIEAIGSFATQPAYPLLVNRILRLTHSYSVIPIVTTNLLIFLLSAVGIYWMARPLLPLGPRILALILYLWNGFAMVHVLQVREYPLILLFLVYNSLFLHQLFDPARTPAGPRYWLTALAHCATGLGAFYTTMWAPMFLWQQAVIALLLMRREWRRPVTVLGSLAVAAIACLPSVLGLRQSNVVFMIWDNRTPTVSLLFTRLYSGMEHLFVGAHRPTFSFLEIYYWVLLALLLGALLWFGSRFLRERVEIQHLVLTVLGFLAFQIAFFFLREPLSTWPRYFILYLPFVVLLVPLVLSRGLVAVRPKVRSRARVYTACLVIAGATGCAQMRSNYVNPYIDHGPDFRVVYRYLISRVAPRDVILVGLRTNRMALMYYWPTPAQIRLGYGLPAATDRPPRIWTVSYRDENSEPYKVCARKLQMMNYHLADTRILAGVTVREFSGSAAAP